MRRVVNSRMPRIKQESFPMTCSEIRRHLVNSFYFFFVADVLLAVQSHIYRRLKPLTVLMHVCVCECLAINVPKHPVKALHSFPIHYESSPTNRLSLRWAATVPLPMGVPTAPGFRMAGHAAFQILHPTHLSMVHTWCVRIHETRQ